MSEIPNTVDDLIVAIYELNHLRALTHRHQIANDYYEYINKAHNEKPPGDNWQRNEHVSPNGFSKGRWHWYRRKPLSWS